MNTVIWCGCLSKDDYLLIIQLLQMFFPPSSCATICPSQSWKCSFCAVKKHYTAKLSQDSLLNVPFPFVLWWSSSYLGSSLQAMHPKAQPQNSAYHCSQVIIGDGSIIASYSAVSATLKASPAELCDVCFDGEQALRSFRAEKAPVFPSWALQCLEPMIFHFQSECCSTKLCILL